MKNYGEYICAVTRDVVCVKFEQVKELQDKLVSISEDYIAEASSNDIVWGIGLDKNDDNISIPAKWKGSNILGWSLMEARSQLKTNQ